jgi:hypothetical protein
MATRIMHGWPILSECAIVEVTTIREGHEFEDLDYLEEEEGIEKLKDAKGNFILVGVLYPKYRGSPVTAQ